MSGAVVRITDLSGGDGEPLEEVSGFADAAEAAAFARRYVRDSVERCRAPGLDAAGVLTAWHAYGEDASAHAGDEAVWTSAAELRAFAETAPRARAERDWRALDPRRRADDGEAEG